MDDNYEYPFHVSASGRVTHDDDEALPEGHATSPFRLVVNGQPVEIEADKGERLSSVIADALSLTGNGRWGGVEKWECRTTQGELLDDSIRLGKLYPDETRGAVAWVNLKPGIGA